MELADALGELGRPARRRHRDAPDVVVDVEAGIVHPHRPPDAERGIVEATARPIADPVVASSLRRLLTKDLLARGKSGIPVASEQP